MDYTNDMQKVTADADHATDADRADHAEQPRGSACGRSVIDRLRGRLIVSSQTHHEDGPLDDAESLVRLAKAAELGGAGAFRVESVAVVRMLRPLTELPIIGIVKRRTPGYAVYITPTIADVEELIDAGADIVAGECVEESRPGESFADLVRAAHARGIPMMADAATTEQALEGAREGADLVATTMAGATAATRHVQAPDLEMARALARESPVPVVVEGGVWRPDQVAAAFEAGAHAVVVGSAITDPERITARFVAATPAAG